VLGSSVLQGAKRVRVRAKARARVRARARVSAVLGSSVLLA